MRIAWGMWGLVACVMACGAGTKEAWTKSTTKPTVSASKTPEEALLGDLDPGGEIRRAPPHFWEALPPRVRAGLAACGQAPASEVALVAWKELGSTGPFVLGAWGQDGGIASLLVRYGCALRHLELAPDPPSEGLLVEAMNSVSLFSRYLHERKAKVVLSDTLSLSTEELSGFAAVGRRYVTGLAIRTLESRRELANAVLFSLLRLAAGEEDLDRMRKLVPLVSARRRANEKPQALLVGAHLVLGQLTEARALLAQWRKSEVAPDDGSIEERVRFRDLRHYEEALSELEAAAKGGSSALEAELRQLDALGELAYPHTWEKRARALAVKYPEDSRIRARLALAPFHYFPEEPVWELAAKVRAGLRVTEGSSRDEMETAIGAMGIQATGKEGPSISPSLLGDLEAILPTFRVHAPGRAAVLSHFIDRARGWMNEKSEDARARKLRSDLTSGLSEALMLHVRFADTPDTLRLMFAYACAAADLHLVEGLLYKDFAIADDDSDVALLRARAGLSLAMRSPNPPWGRLEHLALAIPPLATRELEAERWVLLGDFLSVLALASGDASHGGRAFRAYDAALPLLRSDVQARVLHNMGYFLAHAGSSDAMTAFEQAAKRAGPRAWLPKLSALLIREKDPRRRDAAILKLAEEEGHVDAEALFARCEAIATGVLKQACKKKRSAARQESAINAELGARGLSAERRLEVGLGLRARIGYTLRLDVRLDPWILPEPVGR